MRISVCFLGLTIAALLTSDCSTSLDIYTAVRVKTNELTVYISDVPAEHLESIDGMVKAALKRIADEGVDMDRMRMVLQRERRQNLHNLETSPGGVVSQAVISDLLYGSSTGADLENSFQFDSQYAALEKWSGKDWTDRLRKCVLLDTRRRDLFTLLTRLAPGSLSLLPLSQSSESPLPLSPRKLRRLKRPALPPSVRVSVRLVSRRKSASSRRLRRSTSARFPRRFLRSFLFPKYVAPASFMEETQTHGSPAPPRSKAFLGSMSKPPSTTPLARRDLARFKSTSTPTRRSCPSLRISPASRCVCNA